MEPAKYEITGEFLLKSKSDYARIRKEFERFIKELETHYNFMPDGFVIRRVD